ncbi:hypothetical protein D3C72_2451250 [compost metagenome]
MSKQSSGSRVAEALLNCIEGIKLPGYYAKFGGFPTGGEIRVDSNTGCKSEAGGRIKKTAPAGAVSSVQD